MPGLGNEVCLHGILAWDCYGISALDGRRLEIGLYTSILKTYTFNSSLVSIAFELLL